MARKRIKTLAQEWAVPVEDVLASCSRLRLAHAHSESGLLSPEETDRVKADLDEQVHRSALLRRETVVETSAGTVVEKRLNATVMRRRHAEPTPSTPSEPAEPFHFEFEKGDSGEQFVAPMFEEPLSAEPAIAELPAQEASDRAAGAPNFADQHEAALAESDAARAAAPTGQRQPEPVTSTTNGLGRTGAAEA
jgi:hypothetical protein